MSMMGAFLGWRFTLFRWGWEERLLTVLAGFNRGDGRPGLGAADLNVN